MHIFITNIIIAIALHGPKKKLLPTCEFRSPKPRQKFHIKYTRLTFDREGVIQINNQSYSEVIYT